MNPVRGQEVVANKRCFVSPRIWLQTNINTAYASNGMKRFHVMTLFPEAVEAFTEASMLKRAQDKKLLKIHAVNPRDFAVDKHHTADDRPYGGGPGMVMKAEPILKSVAKALGKKYGARRTKILIMSPRGKQFTQKDAKHFAKAYDDIVLIAGHYEGIDARVKKALRATDVSVGPFVLTGGEVPALLIVDAVARHIPGVLGKGESLEENRLATGEMYTRPETFSWKKKTYAVQKVLISGNHKKIDDWKRKRG